MFGGSIPENTLGGMGLRGKDQSVKGSGLRGWGFDVGQLFRDVACCTASETLQSEERRHVTERAS